MSDYHTDRAFRNQLNAEAQEEYSSDALATGELRDPMQVMMVEDAMQGVGMATITTIGEDMDYRATQLEVAQGGLSDIEDMVVDVLAAHLPDAKDAYLNATAKQIAPIYQAAIETRNETISFNKNSGQDPVTTTQRKQLEASAPAQTETAPTSAAPRTARPSTPGQKA